MPALLLLLLVLFCFILLRPKSNIRYNRARVMGDVQCGLVQVGSVFFLTSIAWLHAANRDTISDVLHCNRSKTSFPLGCTAHWPTSCGRVMGTSSVGSYFCADALYFRKLQIECIRCYLAACGGHIHMVCPMSVVDACHGRAVFIVLYLGHLV